MKDQTSLIDQSSNRRTTGKYKKCWSKLIVLGLIAVLLLAVFRVVGVKKATNEGQEPKEEQLYTEDQAQGLIEQAMSQFPVYLKPIHLPPPLPGQPSTAQTTTPTNCRRPYTDDSLWNTKVADLHLGYHPDSQRMIQDLYRAQTESNFGSNPDSYAKPIYIVTDTTPMKSITISGTFSNVTNGGNDLENSSGTFQVPIPDNAQASSGRDGQLLIINEETGDEWGFWKAVQDDSNSWSARNGYHYNINWSGVPPIGFISRGAGFSYLAGTLRKCEVVKGHIDHALSFSYNHPCSDATCRANDYPHFIHPPATKSDGKGTARYAIPEGARLHISPPASSEELNQWCADDTTCRIIVKALEDYGMILADGGGHPKLATEDNVTAKWGSLLDKKTPRNIPLNRFKVVDFPNRD